MGIDAGRGCGVENDELTTTIEWTRGDDGSAGKTWNPVRGCTRVSEGCTHCYAERMAARNLPEMRSPTTGKPFAILTKSGPRWTGKVELIESKLEEPLHWKKPRRVFVNSMSDLFHEALPDEAIDRVFAVMALCPDHTFQILTKRPERILKYFSGDCLQARIAAFQWGIIEDRVDPLDRRSDDIRATALDPDEDWPLPNVWLGVSVENQAAKDRIDTLREVPAAVRFLSIEPLLEDIGVLDLRGISWVIVGAESGPGARPFNEDWARLTRDQCSENGVAFFYKQNAHNGHKIPTPELDGKRWVEFPQPARAEAGR